MNALVSVVIAVYNGEKYILEAIQSVMSQTYQNIELIVANDGSTDATAYLVQQHYPTVKLIQLPHQGQYSTTNHAISMVQGDYVALLDADDIIMPDKIEIQTNLFQATPDIDMVFGSVEEFVCPSVEGSINLADKKTEISSHLPGSGLFKKTCFDRVGLFDTQWVVGAFIDWYMRAKEVGLKDSVIPELVIRRRIHGANMGFYLRDHRSTYLKIVKAAMDRRSGVKSLHMASNIPKSV